MEKMEVPADTLPVRTRTAFVAVMPVPASPSGGAIGQPGSRVPEGSSFFATSAVRQPAFSPAGSTPGRMSSSFQVTPFDAASLSNFSIIPASN